MDEREEIEGAETTSRRRLDYPRFAALAAALVVGLWILGYLPTRRFVGDAAFPVMLAGGMVSLVASLVGATPLLWVRGRKSAEKISAALGTIALRLAVLLIIGTALALSGFVAPKPFVVWVAVSHLGLLVADTFFALAEMRHGTDSNESPPAKPA